MVSDLSTEIPCNIINLTYVNCYFTKEMIPAEKKDSISSLNIYLKNPCQFNEDTPFYIFISDDYDLKSKSFNKIYRRKKPFIKRLFDLNKKSK